MSRVSVTRSDVSPVTPSRPGPCVTLRGAVLLRSKCDHLNLVQELSSDIIVTNIQILSENKVIGPKTS